MEYLVRISSVSIDNMLLASSTNALDSANSPAYAGRPGSIWTTIDWQCTCIQWQNWYVKLIVNIFHQEASEDGIYEIFLLIGNWNPLRLLISQGLSSIYFTIRGI